MVRRSVILGLLLGTVLAGCPGPTAVLVRQTLCRDTHEGLDATLWVQTAAEYGAAARTVFAGASHAVEVGLADSTWTAALEQFGDSSELPPAVIVDVDETVLDNSPHQGRIVAERSRFHRERWARWVSQSRAAAVPGALDFARAAQASGVTVFYVTNRSEELEDVTRANLTRLGFPLSLTEDVVLCRGEREGWSTLDKGPRRRFVATSHRILALVGDDLNDFVSGALDSPTTRAKLVEANADRFGSRWFVVPNPMYGSWEMALDGFSPDRSRDEILEIKFSNLHSF